MKLDTLIIVIFCSIGMFSQEIEDIEPRSFEIIKRNNTILVDGNLDDDAWEIEKTYSNFWIKYPIDNKLATKGTSFQMFFDDNYLYLGITCEGTSNFIIQTLKRDNKFFESDGFGVLLDPLNKRTNGYFFGVSPFNVQAEGLINNSSFNALDLSWDTKWLSAVQRSSDKWTIEIAIPFNSLIYKNNSKNWGVNFFRVDAKENQIHSWNPIPVNFEVFDLGYTGKIKLNSLTESRKSNIVLVPYLSGSTGVDKDSQKPRSFNSIDAGIDAKLTLGTALKLDLTINPDFSQIEADVQQTNLTRFNIFFPEKRPFFIENSDLFTNFGTPPARPIFTRSIGLDDQFNPIPILYGVKLSGNLSEKSRFGILNLQTLGHENTPAQNYGILVAEKSIFKRSVLKGYLVNRQSLAQKGEAEGEGYGRNTGIEFNFRDVKGIWNPWISVNISKKPNTNIGMFRNAGVRYSTRKWNYFLDYIEIDTDYFADVGFLQRIENYDAERDTIIRRGYKHLLNNLRYTYRPDSESNVILHDFSISNLTVWNEDWSLNETTLSLDYLLQFKNTSEYRAIYDYNNIHLPFPTQFTKGIPLEPDIYKFHQLTLGYNSDRRKKFVSNVELVIGGFYNGTIKRFSKQISYRIQPWGNFGFSFEYNKLKLPAPYGEDELILGNLKTEINFFKNVFLTTFLQYNTQQNNLNINSRFQWRFAPMSDLYISYTDNYVGNPFMHKNRGIVFKLNYWLTL